MTLPHPNRIRRECAEIRALLDEHDRNALPKLYRSTHNMAYDKVRSEEVHVKATGHSNPTQSGVLDTQAQARRKKIEAAANKIQRGFAEIRMGHDLLKGALPEQLDAQQETAPEKDSAVGPGFVREQRERQRARIQNQPWDGDSAEVV